MKDVIPLLVFVVSIRPVVLYDILLKAHQCLQFVKDIDTEAGVTFVTKLNDERSIL